MPNYTLEQICSKKALRYAFGYLLPVVAANTTITYRRIADLLQNDLQLNGRIFSTHIGSVAGALMDHLLGLNNAIPLINVLVVNQTRGSPGKGVDGYLRARFHVRGGLTAQRKAALVATAARQVYAYADWPELYRQAFKAAPPAVDALSLLKGTEKDGRPPEAAVRRGGEAESREHAALNAYVLGHPNMVGITGRPDAAKAELALLSGDEVDVYFETGNRIDLVEVKSNRSNWIDFRRGVYQCVKYRAVFQAQRKKVTPDMIVLPTLVTETEPPNDIRDLAKLHNVRIVVKRVNR